MGKSGEAAEESRAGSLNFDQFAMETDDIIKLSAFPSACGEIVFQNGEDGSRWLEL